MTTSAQRFYIRSPDDRMIVGYEDLNAARALALAAPPISPAFACSRDAASRSLASLTGPPGRPDSPSSQRRRRGALFAVLYAGYIRLQFEPAAVAG